MRLAKVESDTDMNNRLSARLQPNGGCGSNKHLTAHILSSWVHFSFNKSLNCTWKATKQTDCHSKFLLKCLWVKCSNIKLEDLSSLIVTSLWTRYKSNYGISFEGNMGSVSKGKWNKVIYFESILENLVTFWFDSFIKSVKVHSVFFHVVTWLHAISIS